MGQSNLVEDALEASIELFCSETQPSEHQKSRDMRPEQSNIRVCAQAFIVAQVGALITTAISAAFCL
jgi:hypothetical protein